MRDGLVYIQVTRGAGPRNFSFPGPEILPTLVVLARSQRSGWADELAEHGIAVKTMPDNRWGHSDIKTVMLLPAVLAKDAAHSAGAHEAWFVDQSGAITEGASSNAWIVTADGVLVTDDNPRSEDSARIIDDIRAGFARPEAVRFVPGRGQAIAELIASASADDVVLLAGKGHEDYQEIAGVRHPFSDLQEAAKALAAWEVKKDA